MKHALRALLLLLVSPATALAVTNDQLRNLGTDGGPQPAPQIDNGFGGVGRVLLGLVLVVVVIVVLYLGLKRAQKGRLPGLRRSGSITVLETAPLGPGRNLHLVEVGDRVLLVGATDHGIAMLQSFDGDLLAAAPEPALDQPLADLLELPRRGLLDGLRERTSR